MIISKRNFFHLMGWRNLVGVQNTCYTAIFLLKCQTDLKRKYYNSFGFEIYIVINFVLVLFVTALKVNMTANMPFPVMFSFIHSFKDFGFCVETMNAVDIILMNFIIDKIEILKNSLQNINNLSGTRQNYIGYVAKWKEIIPCQIHFTLLKVHLRLLSMLKIVIFLVNKKIWLV